MYTVTISDRLPKAYPIALGTDYYGKTIPESDAFALLDAYTEAGGNIIDTAHVYSDYLPGEQHMSEKVIGRWLRSTGRQGTIIATKGGFPQLGDMHKSRIRYAEIASDLEESLDCLGVQSVDIYWLHRDDTSVPVGEIVDWLDELGGTGAFRCWGVSNWDCARMEEACEYARRHGRQEPTAGQVKWSLAQTVAGSVDDDTLVEMDRRQYEWYERSHMPVFAYSSQAKGFFSKLSIDDAGVVLMPQGKAGQRYGSDENVRIWHILKSIANDNQELSVGAVALAWLMKAQRITTIPIIGCRTVAQLNDSIKACEVSEELLSVLPTIDDRRLL